VLSSVALIPCRTAVVNTGKTIGQGAIVAGGLALLGVAGYFIFQEMWSSNSPLSLFGAISDKLVADKRVQNAIGHPVVAATSRTGRRSYTVAQTQGVDSDGKKTMEIYYYLKGGVYVSPLTPLHVTLFTCRGNASVVSQFVLEKGSYVHRMSVVDTNAFGRRQQILIEN